MGILQFNSDTTGLVGDLVAPRRVTMVSTDDIATVTAAGYINAVVKSGKQVYPTDVVEALYDFDPATNVGTFAIFTLLYDMTSGWTLDLWENPGDVLLPVTDGNISIFNGTTGQIKDGLIPGNRILYTGFASPDVNANIIYFSQEVTVAALNVADVTLFASSGSKNYILLQMFLNDGGTNFSGGGGDRLLDILSDTTVYSQIAAADLQALPGNLAWGATKLPFPLAGNPINAPLGAGVSLQASNSGGTTDYTTGSVTISGLVMRIA